MLVVAGGEGLAAVTLGSLHVLAMGAPGLGSASVGPSTAVVPLLFGEPTTSQRLVVPEGLPPALHRLVEHELVPLLKGTSHWREIGLRTFGVGGPRLPLGLLNSNLTKAGLVARPFVIDRRGAALAGEFPRSDGVHGGRSCWALPHVPEHPGPWLAAAFETWHKLTPDRAPVAPWPARAPWTTREERDLDASTEGPGEERARVLADLDCREQDLHRRRALAAAAAERGDRRLLSAQGDVLVHAVARALRRVGFDAEESDAAVGRRAAPRGPGRDSPRPSGLEGAGRGAGLRPQPRQDREPDPAAALRAPLGWQAWPDSRGAPVRGERRPRRRSVQEGASAAGRRRRRHSLRRRRRAGHRHPRPCSSACTTPMSGQQPCLPPWSAGTGVGSGASVAATDPSRRGAAAQLAG